MGYTIVTIAYGIHHCYYCLWDTPLLLLPMGYTIVTIAYGIHHCYYCLWDTPLLLLPRLAFIFNEIVTLYTCIWGREEQYEPGMLMPFDINLIHPPYSPPPPLPHLKFLATVLQLIHIKLNINIIWNFTWDYLKYHLYDSLMNLKKSQVHR